MDWLWFLGFVAAVAWIVAIVDMVRRRASLSRGQLGAWLLIVIILPGPRDDPLLGVRPEACGLAASRLSTETSVTMPGEPGS